MADSGQRTEKPSARRLEKARKEGRVASSRDFVAAIQFLAVVVLIASWGWESSVRMARWFRVGLIAAFDQGLDVSSVWIAAWLEAVAASALLPVLAAGAALALVGFGTHLGVTGLNWSGANLALDWSRLSPGRRLREIRRQNLPQALHAVILIPAFALVVWVSLEGRAGEILALPRYSLGAGLLALGGIAQGVAWKVGALLLAWGVFDLVRQKRRILRDLRMTKQEVRDESKETDGNPQIKSKLRRLQRDLLRRKMMAQVPLATAVVVNPTHFAVAIRYVPDSMAAPSVVAKGKNWLALRIRARAVECGVPIVENPPLAQALYKSTAVGSEIPAALYRAVAEILAYVFHLRRRQAGRRSQ
jgi:flagellar biosynthetic protein FlhB